MLFACLQGAAVLELHKVVRRTGNRITFQTYDDRVKPLKSGRVYAFICGWSRDQLQLVRDSSRRWKKETFTPRGAVDLSHKEAIKALRLRREGEDVIEGNLIAGGWDHEHCFLCWRKILPGEADNGAGFRMEKNGCVKAVTKRILSLVLAGN